MIPRLIATAVLCLLFVASPGYGQGLAVEGDNEIRSLAVEIAYRIDRELGVVDGAQRHLLVWRLSTALVDGELTAGASLADDWLVWQQRLEQLEPTGNEAILPAWFEPVRPDAIAAMLASNDVSEIGLDWRAATLMTEQISASMAAVLESGDLPMARVVLPGLLAWSRDHGVEIWRQFLTELLRAPELLPLVEPLVNPWLALPLDSPLSDWAALEDESARAIRSLRGGSVPSDPIANLSSTVDLLQSESLHIDIRDPTRLLDGRYASFLGSDRLDALDRGILSLSRTVERLENGGYASLIQVLSGLAFVGITRPDLLQSRERLSQVLDELARLDDWLPQQVAFVDGRLLTVYQELRRILRDWTDNDTELALPRQQLLHDLGALGTVLDLSAQDLDGYLAQPFRQSFENNLLICFGLGGERDAYPPEPISRQDFDNCSARLSDWALTSALQVELSGDPGGPFESDHRERELVLNPFQRINYWSGYLQEGLEESCELESDQALPNPLEWAQASRAFVRFAQHWPAYFAAADLDETVDRMIDVGRRLMTRAADLDACRSQFGGNPVLRAFGEYEVELGRVGEAIAASTESYRASRLRPGADVDFAGDAWQTTRFRPEDRMVRSCTLQPSCDMNEELPSSRALFELFPGPLLVADQIGLAEVSLCYSDVQWTDRRAELPQVRNPAMANYFGRLSFDLHGQFAEGEAPVFRMRLTSGQEYEYLFGANSEEVLSDTCPRHLINTQVQSQLPERKIQLVPRRLTYMTADRMHPAKVFEFHWAQGDEWRDWFVTGRGVERIESTGPEDIVPAVNDRLRELNEEWNGTIYVQMLTDDPLGNGDDTGSQLRDAMRSLDLAKKTLQAIARLVFPEPLKNDPALRASLFGENALFDQRGALQMQRDQVPVNMIDSLARSHFSDSVLLWQRATSARVTPRIRQDEMVVSTLVQLKTLR